MECYQSHIVHLALLIDLFFLRPPADSRLPTNADWRMHGSSTHVVPTTTSRKQIPDLGALLWGHSWWWSRWCTVNRARRRESGMQPRSLKIKAQGYWQRSSAASMCVELTLTAAEQICCKSIFQVHSHRGAVIADGTLFHQIPRLTGGGSIATHCHAAASWACIMHGTYSVDIRMRNSRLPAGGIWCLRVKRKYKKII